MSYTITFKVADGVVGDLSISSTAPNGNYTITGHDHTPGTAGPMVNCVTPTGQVMCSLPAPRFYKPEAPATT